MEQSQICPAREQSWLARLTQACKLALMQKQYIYAAGIIGGLAAIFIVGWVFLKQDDAPQASGPDQNATAPTATDSTQDDLFPDFSLASLNGNTVTRDDLKGQVTLVRFMATTCSICAIENPTLNKLNADDSLDVRFVDINIAEPRDLVQDYVNEVGIKHDVLLDTDGAVTIQNGVLGTPTSYVLRADASVCRRHSGLYREADLLAEFESCG